MSRESSGVRQAQHPRKGCSRHTSNSRNGWHPCTQLHGLVKQERVRHMGDGPSRDSRYMWKGWSQDKYLEGQAVGEVRGASGRAPGGTEAEAQLCGQPGVETVGKEGPRDPHSDWLEQWWDMESVVVASGPRSPPG